MGSRLPSEEKLGRSYGVSRPIIREAMRSLQTLGLTRARSGSGSFVISDRQQADLAFGDVAITLQLFPSHTIEYAVGSEDALDPDDEDEAGVGGPPRAGPQVT